MVRHHGAVVVTIRYLAARLHWVRPQQSNHWSQVGEHPCRLERTLAESHDLLHTLEHHSSWCCPQRLLILAAPHLHLQSTAVHQWRRLHLAISQNQRREPRGWRSSKSHVRHELEARNMDDVISCLELPRRHLAPTYLIRFPHCHQHNHDDVVMVVQCIQPRDALGCRFESHVGLTLFTPVRHEPTARSTPAAS